MTYPVSHPYAIGDQVSVDFGFRLRRTQTGHLYTRVLWDEPQFTLSITHPDLTLSEAIAALGAIDAADGDELTLTGIDGHTYVGLIQGATILPQVGAIWRVESTFFARRTSATSGTISSTYPFTTDEILVESGGMRRDDGVIGYRDSRGRYRQIERYPEPVYVGSLVSAAVQSDIDAAYYRFEQRRGDVFLLDHPDGNDYSVYVRSMSYTAPTPGVRRVVVDVEGTIT